MRVFWWQWYYNKTQHTNIYITQNNTLRSNKDSTQSYTNNEAQVTTNTTPKKVKLERFQLKALCKKTDAPWYEANNTEISQNYDGSKRNQSSYPASASSCTLWN
jgi:hypothetical protein